MRAIKVLGIAVLLAGFGFAAEEQPQPLVEARLFNGLTHRGLIVQEDDDALVIQTSMGRKRVARREIVHFRRSFSAAERERILSSLPPASAPEKETVARRVPGLTMEIGRVVERGGGAPPFHAPVQVVGRQIDWGKVMAAGLSRRLTLEFVDTNLSEAIAFVATVTRLNIIINPKVREKNLKVNLRVKDMDAGNVLKWMARLTDTHIELVNKALYVTDEPSPAAADAERTEALLLLARVGADPSVMPAEGQPLTDADRIRIAMAIWEKENPKPTDFPAPELRLDDSFLRNPWGNVP